MKLEDEQNKELYAILQVSPEATDEEIRKAYRHWAQVYHPDKNQDPFMNEAATVNFRRVCEAYEILSDKNKRQVYDIYGMEGVNSALELGPYLDKANQIKEELEKLRRLKEHEKIASHFRPTGTILAHLSYPHLMARDGFFKGMSMNSEVHSQLSKKTAFAIGGSLEVRGNAGGSAATGVLRHQLSNHSSVEFFASAGLRGLLGVQTTRNLSVHSNASISLTRSFEDGSINLTNVWNRQLSDSTNANIHLALGPESSISVGWQKKDENMSAAGQLQIGTSSFGASARYMHRFSPKSHGRVACKIGSNALEVEIGGGRKISDFSTVRLMYLVGIQGMFWRFELHRGGQKLILPLLISRDWNLLFAVGAFIVPSSFYLILKKTVLKPYFLRRERIKGLELKEKTFEQVKEGRAAAEKTQQLMRNVANRKRNKQMDINGVIITRAMYGSGKAIERVKAKEEEEINGVDSEVFDVTLPLNFLLNDYGELKLHEGVKKSGIMGFCDPCPAEAKQLLVEYTRGGRACQVIVDDFGELLIPLEGHKL